MNGTGGLAKPPFGFVGKEGTAPEPAPAPRPTPGYNPGVDPAPEIVNEILTEGTEALEANPLYPVPRLMDKLELERLYEKAADWS